MRYVGKHQPEKSETKIINLQNQWLKWEYLTLQSGAKIRFGGLKSVVLAPRGNKIHNKIDHKLACSKHTVMFPYVNLEINIC